MLCFFLLFIATHPLQLGEQQLILASDLRLQLLSEGRDGHRQHGLMEPWYHRVQGRKIINIIFKPSVTVCLFYSLPDKL